MRDSTLANRAGCSRSSHSRKTGATVNGKRSRTYPAPLPRLPSRPPKARNLAIRQAGNDRRHHHPHRHSGIGQLADCPQPGGGRAGPRLHDRANSASSVVRRRSRAGLGRHLLENVQIAQHQRVLGDDRDRLPGFAATCRHRRVSRNCVRPADNNRSRRKSIISGCQESRAKHAGTARAPLLDQHFRLEIEPGVETEIFVTRPGIAIAATVGTAAIGIDAVAKRDVGTVVFRDDAFRLVRDVYGRGVVEGSISS